MSYRVMTVCLEKEKNASLLTNVVATLSDNRPTHVQTVHVMPSGTDYISMSPYVQAVPLAKLYDLYEEICAKIKSSYQECQKQYPDSITWDWHDYQGFSLGDYTPYIQHAMVSDLVVCCKPPELSIGSTLPKLLVNEASTPVLVVPEDMDPATSFKRITLAWNETPEAAHAIRDALPLLKQAELVVVVNVKKKEDKSSMAGADIGRYLGEHNIPVEIDHVASADNIGSTIMKHVNDNFMDLLVMGGFGHSSLYNMAFGAATPQVLKELPCPVFLSH